MTNIEHLKVILGNYELENTEEAMEFVEAIEKELEEKDTDIEDLKNEYAESDMEDEDEKEAEYDNSDFVGLDTINWSLDNGNLVIQQKMEYFIESLRKTNCVGTTHF